MLKEELRELVKDNLKIEDDSKDLIIDDVIQEVLSYCNLKEIPEELEPFIRKKVKTIIDYETENGPNNVFDVKSIKEGDTSITYNTDQISKETIYGLSDRDKKTLQQFRRLRK
ncbi:MAG: Phage gp6-like head-tail connector protein [Thermoanaerobacterium thermosaccharolyticum]|jgi:polynucleotide 5'-kinase involved in rRNA processing